MSEKPKNSLTEPAVLRDLVSLQDDAIVSRVLLKNRSGNITLFAFAAGQSLSEHKTPHDAMVMVIEGAGIIELGGQRHRVQQGQVLLLPANESHAVHAERPFKMMLTMMKEGRPGNR